MITVAEQIRMIVLFIILGIFMSIMIDVADVFRSKNKIITSFLQIVFWMGITFVVCKVVIVISKGYLPIYTFGFFLIGYFIYRFLLRKQFVAFVDKIKLKYNQRKKKAFNILFPNELFRQIKKIFKFVLVKIKRIKFRKKVENEAEDVI